MFTVKPINRCGKEIRTAADSGTDYVGFENDEPNTEFSHRDGKTWVREFGADRSVPFRPLCDGYRGSARIERFYLQSQIEG